MSKQDALNIGANRPSLEAAVRLLQNFCHNQLEEWWVNPDTKEDWRDNPLCFPTKVARVIGELSEAVEAHRTNEYNTEIGRPNKEVELADAFILLLDLAGAYNIDLAGAMTDKLLYCASRNDHTMESREGVHGKKY